MNKIKRPLLRKCQIILLLLYIAFVIIGTKNIWLPDRFKPVPVKPVLFGRKYTRRDELIDFIWPKPLFDVQGNVCLLDCERNSVLIMERTSRLYEFLRHDPESTMININGSFDTDTMPRKVSFGALSNGFWLRGEFSDKDVILTNPKYPQYSTTVPIPKNSIILVHSVSEQSCIPITPEQYMDIDNLLTDNRPRQQSFLEIYSKYEREEKKSDTNHHADKIDKK